MFTLYCDYNFGYLVSGFAYNLEIVLPLLEDHYFGGGGGGWVGLHFIYQLFACRNFFSPTKIVLNIVLIIGMGASREYASTILYKDVFVIL